MAKLRIVRRYTLITLEVRKEELSNLLADGVEEVAPELELLDVLLRLGEEEGELDYYEEEEIAYDPKIHSRLFSPKIIQILDEIGKGVDSISDLARKVNRDVGNVWRDLAYLSRVKMIALVKIEGKVKPIPLVVEYGIVI